MPDFTAEINSSSSTLLEKREHKHFRWDTLKKFLVVTSVYSNNVFNFNIFAKSKDTVRIFEFTLCQIFVGMPYMVMDGFIKQYTRRINGNKFLNPLLKGITFGQFLQSCLWTVLQSSYIADSIRFLVMTFKSDVPWTQCHSLDNNSTCKSLENLLDICRVKKKEYDDYDDDNDEDEVAVDDRVLMNITAGHHHYMNTFSDKDRSVVTSRCFVLGLVWLFNFLITTVTEETLLKVYYFSFTFGSISTAAVAIILLIAVGLEHGKTALSAIMNVKTPPNYPEALSHVTTAYGVGLFGFVDCGTMSPYTMIDTAVILFSVVFTIFALARSWIIKVMLLKIDSCIKVEKISTTHYLYYAVLPLSTEFLRMHKLYALFIYSNIMTATAGQLTMRTLTMSKLLHSEFRSVKNLYIVSLVCCFGLILSLPFTITEAFTPFELLDCDETMHYYAPFVKAGALAMGARMKSSTSTKFLGFLGGLNVTVLYLGGFKVAIIMWVYGVKKFSTDIQFWLGFKPTRFWTLSWGILPLILLVMLIYRMWLLILKAEILSLTWFGATVLIVAIINIKTISKYLVRNNLAALFTANVKYGPPDARDRRNRRNYSETVQLRRCKHNCQVIDELIDCNHMPLMTSAIDSSTSSLGSATKDIYKSDNRNRSLLNIAHHHY